MNVVPCEVIAQGLGALFTCAFVNGYTRVRTPFLYPDGDVIDLFISEQNGVFTVTDLGETLRWLKMQSISGVKRSPRQQRLIEDVSQTHGLEVFRGMLVARAREPNELTSVIVRAAQGALRVADIWFTMRTRSVESVTDEVEQLLLERVIPFERGQQLVGRSGRVWRPDFHTRLPQKSSLVHVLSTGSRAAAHSVANYVVASWVDLNNLKVGPEALQFVSLFDDTMDVWGQEDFNLVGNLSVITRWSRPDEFIETLAEAA
jgi:hypothetical protein